MRYRTVYEGTNTEYRIGYEEYLKFLELSLEVAVVYQHLLVVFPLHFYLGVHAAF